MPPSAYSTSLNLAVLATASIAALCGCKQAPDETSQEFSVPLPENFSIPLPENRFARDAQFSPDGKKIAVFDKSLNRTVIHDSSRGAKLLELPIRFRGFSADGSLCTGLTSDGRDFAAYESSSGDLQFKIPGARGFCTLAHDARGAFRYETQGIVFLPAPGGPFFDPRGSPTEIICKFESGAATQVGVTPSPCGRFAVGGNSGKILDENAARIRGIWDLRTGDFSGFPLMHSLDHRVKIYGIRFADSGDFFYQLSPVSVLRDRPRAMLMKGFETTSAKKTFEFEVTVTPEINGFVSALSGDGRVFAFASSALEVTFIDTQQPTTRKIQSTPDPPGSKQLNQIALNSDGSRIASYADHAHQLFVWDTPTLR